jgi:hypothetical protein
MRTILSKILTLFGIVEAELGGCKPHRYRRAEVVVCLENSAKVRAIGVAELVPYSSLDEVRNPPRYPGDCFSQENVCCFGCC